AITVRVDELPLGQGTVRDDGTFNVPVAPLQAGTRVTAVQIQNGLTSDPSTPVLVVARPSPPVVNSPLVAGALSVTGTGVAGAVVVSLVEGGSRSQGTVQGDGSFSVGVAPLQAGTHVTAVQTQNGVTSAPSAAVLVVARTAPPVVNSPLIAGALSVTGTG